MAEIREHRTGWIDICKAIAIYCMVLGHTGTSEIASIVIHTFHMPVFFILSGYCFNEAKNSDLLAFAKKRFKTLIIPYFIFGVGLFLLWDAALYIMHRQSEMRSITNLLTSILWNNADASAFGVIQWFLPCLFFAEIIFVCLLKISKCSVLKIGGGLTIISIVAYAIPYLNVSRMPWAFDCALMASVFYGLGWIMRKMKIIERFSIIKSHKAVAFSITSLVAIAMIPSVLLNGAVNMRTISYGNYFLYFINAILYSSVLIVISILLESTMNGKKLCCILKWIGRNTLIILMLNSTCIRVYEVIFEKSLNGLSNTMVNWINAVVAVVITIVCVIASEVINRYLPWLVGKPKKKCVTMVIVEKNNEKH